MSLAADFALAEGSNVVTEICTEGDTERSDVTKVYCQ